jgi:hypothetical protein
VLIQSWVERFDAKFKSATILMAERAKDEKNPFAEKYEAR